MNKKIKSRAISTSKKRLPRYADGWYNADGITKAGTNTASTIGGIGSVVSGVSGLLKTEDEGSAGNYAANILGDAGQYASMGAALGPWGAVGGAVLGAGIGLSKSIGADAAQNKREKLEAINVNMGNINDMSNQVNTKYNMRNFANDRIPGLNKGVVKFKSGHTATNEPNALLMPGEGVMDGDTGRLSMVPGSGNKDDVYSNLTEGTSIFSKKDSQTIPGGKSTPADIIARAEKMQKINDKILTRKDSDRKLSFIDKRTAEINRMNIKTQADNLNKYNMLLNPMQSNAGELPKFGGGWVYFKTENINGGETRTYAASDKEVLANPGLYKKEFIETDENGYIPGTKNKPMLDGKLVSKNDLTIKAPASETTAATQVLNTPTTAETKGAASPIALKTNPGAFKQKFEARMGGLDAMNGTPVSMNTGYIQDSVSPEIITKPVIQQPSVNELNAASIVQKNQVEKTKERYDGIQKTIDNPTSSTDVANTGASTSVEASGSSSKPSSPAFSTIGFNRITDANMRLKTPNTPTFDSGENATTTNTQEGEESTLGADLRSLGNNLMSLAPGVYNAFNNEPEIAKPIYDNYMNVNQRYNIAPELSDAVKQRQIARYGNASLNTSTGANQAYGADLYSRGVEQVSGLMNKQQLANNSYRQDYANRYNEFGARNTSERRRIEDINMRNRAASRSFGAKNAEMMSQYGQTQELMGNQKKADVLNSNIWNGFASAMSKEDREMYMRMVKKYTNIG